MLEETWVQDFGQTLAKVFAFPTVQGGLYVLLRRYVLSIKVMP